VIQPAVTFGRLAHVLVLHRATADPAPEPATDDPTP
jgi:hypothetical protein